ncbi:MAG: lipoyl synthase [Chloroflexi bacterium]|nr:lipoyl synthase [Chloroflexota bacterium]
MATLPLPIVPRTVPLSVDAPAPRGSRPAWLKVKFPQGDNYTELRDLMRAQSLHTICEEALCPNIGECWENRTATFLILGDVCTRNCGFCNVTTGRPTGLDLEEPRRLAEAVEKIGLRHIVITSVTRDDLPDGGSQIFAETIRELRQRVPDCGIEVLIPDFQGNWDALATVMEARPDILNHNLETVPRLYRRVRPKAIYEQSLELLRRGKELAPDIVTKSGLMAGLGETREELLQVFTDLRTSQVDVLTVGQYLRPTMRHLPVERYVPPEEFAELKVEAQALGFGHVESGPLVRSSYHAHQQVPGAGAANRSRSATNVDLAGAASD